MINRAKHSLKKCPESKLLAESYCHVSVSAPYAWVWLKRRFWDERLKTL